MGLKIESVNEILKGKRESVIELYKVVPDFK